MDTQDYNTLLARYSTQTNAELSTILNDPASYREEAVAAAKEIVRLRNESGSSVSAHHEPVAIEGDDETRVDIESSYQRIPETLFWRLFSYRGRVSRIVFAKYSVPTMLIAFLALVILALFTRIRVTWTMLPMLLPGLLVISPLGVKRLHDFGIPRWCLVGVAFVSCWMPQVIAVVVFGAVLVALLGLCFAVPGKSTANKYGPPPEN